MLSELEERKRKRLTSIQEGKNAEWSDKMKKKHSKTLENMRREHSVFWSHEVLLSPRRPRHRLAACQQSTDYQTADHVALGGTQSDRSCQKGLHNEMIAKALTLYSKKSPPLIRAIKEAYGHLFFPRHKCNLIALVY